MFITNKHKKQIIEQIHILIKAMQKLENNQDNFIEQKAKVIKDLQDGIQMCINGINQDREAINKIIAKLTKKAVKK